MTPDQETVDKHMQGMKWSYWSNKDIFLSSVEELGEIARIIGALEGEKKPKPGDNIDLEGEVGDLYFSIICLANKNNINLSNALTKAMDKYKVRDKDRFNT
jgi:NTP pyrophosphatase (non-canonical NTP hydrolase)